MKISPGFTKINLTFMVFVLSLQANVFVLPYFRIFSFISQLFNVRGYAHLHDYGDEYVHEYDCGYGDDYVPLFQDEHEGEYAHGYGDGHEHFVHYRDDVHGNCNSL